MKTPVSVPFIPPLTKPIRVPSGSLRVSLAILVLVSFLPAVTFGLGISPGSAEVTVAVRNTNMVRCDFFVSFWPTEEGLTYWTTNFLVGDAVTASNCFVSFDPVVRLTSLETAPIEGHATNGVTGYLLSVFVGAPDAIPSPPDQLVNLFVVLKTSAATGGGIQFQAGVIAPITVHVVPWPVAISQNVTTPEDTPVEILLAGWDQEGSPLTYSVVQGPTAGTLTGTPPQLTYRPNTNFGGADQFTFKVNDGTWDSAPATVSLTVTAINDAPFFTFEHPDLRVNEGERCGFSVAAYDVEESWHLLDFSLVANAPAGLASNVYLVAGGGSQAEFWWIPDEDQGLSTNLINIIVSDHGDPRLSATTTVKVVVAEVNKAPVWQPMPDQVVAELTPLTLTNRATDPDLPANRLTYELLAAPVGMSLNPTNGVLTWTPTEEQGPSTKVVSVKVTDDGEPSLSATQSFVVTVLEVSQAPSLRPAEFGADGRFRLLLTAFESEAGIEYVIEASTNLWDWVARATNTVGLLETWAFEDLEATHSPQCFYRARYQRRTPQDVIWVDDSLPAGAVTGGNEGWNWVSSNPAPYSGSFASQSDLRAGEHQHYFHSAIDTLAVNAGDVLFAYIYLDPDHLPGEVMLQWFWGGGSSYASRAYWGANIINWGTDGTASRRYMGPLPVAGQWVRLQVPAALVDLEGAVLDGLGFTLWDGRATWDCAGKASP